MRARRPRIRGAADAESERVARIACERGVDNAARTRFAENNRPVVARDGPRLQLSHELDVGGKSSRDDHQPRRLCIEAMNDSSAWNRGKFGVPIQQSVEQRARPVTRGRVHYQPRWLVEDDD